MYQIGLRYGWSIANLLTTCPCGSRFTIQHCMSCKKEGFVSIRHKDLRDLAANMLSEVFKVWKSSQKRAKKVRQKN